ncbi:MAG: hypothetical protein M3409_00850, partial [Gemmatimonadota bacterium]|nr:hypothetical protein [Gemmatimonadota bacterium]
MQEVVRGWDRALRAFLLYEGTGPTIERLMALLRRQTAALWDVLPELSLTVEENVLRWGEEGVYAAEAGTENLAFVFYRDGIRELTLLPGFEDETAGWVALLARVQRVRSDDEDLLTLLWDGEWRSLRYLYVDSSSDGAPLPGGSGRPATAVSAPVEEESAATSGVSPDNFQGALYFLDDAEIRRLGDDLRAEMGRDLLADVVAALMDRFEDGTPARQELVVGILADLLPVLLGAGQLARAVELLREMADLRSAAPTPSPPVLQAISTLFERLGDPEVLAGLVSVANDVPEVVASDALQRFLALLYPSALGALVRLVPDVESERIRAAVLAGAERLAAAHPEEVRPLLQSDDP